METKQELRRLQYVTSNFFGLQGLRQVAVGVMMLLLLPALDLPDPWRQWLLLLLFLLLGVSWWRLGVYYERRFGQVRPRAGRWNWPGGGSMARRGLFWGSILALYLVTRVGFHIIFPPEWFLGFLFLAFFLVEGRPWYYLPFAVPFLALPALHPSSHPQLPIISLWLLPLAFILTGVLDHRMLVRSLGGVPPHGAA